MNELKKFALVVFFFSELFRSLLYEACGRIVNPINGSVGLLWSGSWQLCHAAVEAVLKGAPIMPITFEPTTNMWGPPPNIYDIRHVSKDESSIVPIEAEVVKTRSKLKQVISSVIKPKATKRNHSVCHESSSSHRFESESAVSAEASINIHDELDSNSKLSDHQARENGNEVGLELKLGFESTSRVDCSMPMKKRKIDMKNWLC